MYLHPQKLITWQSMRWTSIPLPYPNLFSGPRYSRSASSRRNEGDVEEKAERLLQFQKL